MAEISFVEQGHEILGYWGDDPCCVEDTPVGFIASVARTCYRSKPKDPRFHSPYSDVRIDAQRDADESLVESLIRRDHGAMLEHSFLSVRFVTDRAIANEIVRHRHFSFAQESTRYCVAGDMVLTPKNNNLHGRMTIRDLFHKKERNINNVAWRRIKIKQFNEDTGELQYATVRDVFYMGEKPCVRIKTRIGYVIECTKDHKILTPNGYVQAECISINDDICVNGTTLLYKNREWLYNQNITLNKTFVQIANEFGFNVSTVKKWARKLGIPKKAPSYWNRGRIPWNKGKGNASQSQIDALRKYHHCGRRNDYILKEDTSKYQKYTADACAICGSVDDLQVHHIDEDRSNNYPSNLMTLCRSCHLRIHSKNLETCYTDKVVAVEDVGIKDVYDVSMDSTHHNFVANGVVVHNCNYDRRGFEFVLPEGLDHEEDVMMRATCYTAAERYNFLIEHGTKPEIARAVLPLCTATTIVVSGNFREWRHMLKLRTAKDAHPQMRALMLPLLDELRRTVPILFEDVGE